MPDYIGFIANSVAENGGQDCNRCMELREGRSSTSGRALKRGDLLLRYAAADDFGKPATAFLICAFWYVDALNAIGRRDEARAIFERVLALRNPFDLFSEDVDVASGELWGNFPQTFSMVGLINSATRLSKSWEEAF